MLSGAGKLHCREDSRCIVKYHLDSVTLQRYWQSYHWWILWHRVPGCCNFFASPTIRRSSPDPPPLGSLLSPAKWLHFFLWELWELQMKKKDQTWDEACHGRTKSTWKSYNLFFTQYLCKISKIPSKIQVINNYFGIHHRSPGGFGRLHQGWTPWLTVCPDEICVLHKRALEHPLKSEESQQLAKETKGKRLQKWFSGVQRWKLLSLKHLHSNLNKKKHYTATPWTCLRANM